MDSCQNNIMYGGYAAYCDGYTYMAYPGDWGLLYRFGEYFNKKEKMLDDAVSNILVCKDQLWFKNNEDGCFYRRGFAQDTKPQIVLDKRCKFIYVVDDGLYYLYKDCVMKSDLDGGNESVLISKEIVREINKDFHCSEIEELLVTEEDMFFTSGYAEPVIRRCGLNGENFETLIGPALNLTIEGDYLYYCLGDDYYADRDYQFADLARMRVHSHDTGDETPLYKSKTILGHDVANVLADDGIVYFSDRSCSRSLRSYNPVDGSFNTVVDSPVGYPQSAGDKIICKKYYPRGDLQNNSIVATKTGRVVRYLSERLPKQH